jgi:hypothetical protein
MGDWRMRALRRIAPPRLFVYGAVLTIGVIALAAWSVGAAGDRRDHRTAVEVYPTADRLPANLLRLYLVFERPMSTGESHERLQLLDDAGRRVEGAFLHLEEELWDPTGRRLTVLFDPGRIKRGLRANLEDGPPLASGRRYRLVVDGGWRDADGRPLGTTVTKAFEAVGDDRTSPAIGQWTIEPPAAGTRGPLVVRFPELLDRALLSSAIGVVDAEGNGVGGEIDVPRGERAWTSTPEASWREGHYDLRVSTELEDVAGNSLRRVFDAEIAPGPRGAQSAAGVVSRSFGVTLPPEGGSHTSP